MIDEVQAREDILARIRQATADVTQSDPQKDAPCLLYTSDAADE